MANRLKVFFVCHEYPPMRGGIGVSVKRIVANLEEEGTIEPTVVYFRKVDRVLLMHQAVQTRTDGGILVHEVLVPLHQESRCHEAIFSDSQATLESFLQLERLVQRHQPDLLVGFYLTTAGFVTASVARKHELKCLLSIRGNDVGKLFFDPGMLSRIQYCLQNSVQVVAVNRELLEMANTVVDVTGKSGVIHNSVPSRLREHKVRHRPPIFHLGTMGIFKYKKGLPYLLAAVANLQNRWELRLSIIGEPKDEEERTLILGLLNEFKLQEITTVTGFRVGPEKFRLLNELDIFVQPSLFSEGCPNTLLEAVSVGLPIVASRVGAMKDIIVDGEHGLLVSPGDPVELEEKLETLLESWELRNCLSRGALGLAEQLTPEKERDEWLGVIRRCCAPELSLGIRSL